MTTTLPWTRRDKRRAQEILKKVSDHYGGWQGIADKLGLSAEGSRATVQAWHRRGRVSLAQIHPVRELARKAGIPCTLTELSPQAKHMERLS